MSRIISYTLHDRSANEHLCLRYFDTTVTEFWNVLDIETSIHKLAIDKMESDNVQHENELAEHIANGTEDIPLNQEHLKSAGM